MAAAYDTFDYPAYWKGRDYEHKSEVIALNSFLSQISKIGTILEIGSGFGRLASIYSYRSKKIILSDPSAKLLKIARKNVKKKNSKFIQSKLENLPKKIRSGSIDLILMIRVMHHITDIENTISIIEKLLSKRGYLILEFANKRHWKAVGREMLKGNILYPLDIFPKDIRSKKNIKKKTLPFVHYHPDIITHTLDSHGFDILEKRSVSNIRIPFVKNILPEETILIIERELQKILAPFNFGPSVFLLCQKRG